MQKKQLVVCSNTIDDASTIHNDHQNKQFAENIHQISLMWTSLVIVRPFFQTKTW